MSFQLIIDIGLFLVYIALFTLLLAWAWKFWMLYVNNSYLNGLNFDILEIRLPREINKSPVASELFLRSIIEGGGLGNWLKENWNGGMPVTASLEIVSLEGVIHFYIRTEAKIIPRVEAAIYSQYPNVEIVNLKNADYMYDLPKFVHNGKDNPFLWGTTWVLSKTSKTTVPDKAKTKLDEDIEYSGDMYPIKTHVDWGLDKDPKEMYKNDPLTYLIEQLGSVGPGEYFLHQIIIRDATKWNGIYSLKGGRKESGVTLKSLVDFELANFKTKWSIKKKGTSIGEDEVGLPKMTKEERDKDGNIIKEAKKIVYAEDIIEQKTLQPTEREDDAKGNILQIQRKMSKPQVICVMRTIYMCKGKMPNGRIPMLMGIVKPFNEENGFNTFRPDYVADPFNYPWEDRKGRKVAWRKENLYEGYISRSGLFSFSNSKESFSNNLDKMFFSSPSYKRWLFEDLWNVLIHPFSSTMNLSGFTLNVEELATLFHFPGEVAATPTLPRVDSVKSSQPANLPIER